MSTTSDTYESAELRATDYRRRGAWDVLQRLTSRLSRAGGAEKSRKLAAREDAARPEFPNEDEVRLALHALGRGFDCM